MSLQGSWNAAMGSIAGALHFQDVRERMSQAEERRVAREKARQPSGSGTTRESPKAMETEEGRQRIAQSREEENQNYENYLTNQYAAQQAQDHLAQADTSQNSVAATVQAAQRRKTAPRGLSKERQEAIRQQWEKILKEDEEERSQKEMFRGNK